MRALLGERPRDRNAKVSQNLIAQMEAMGARPEQISKLRNQAKPESRTSVVEVEPELWDAFRIFRIVEPTQWRWETLLAGRTVITMRHGLDYGPVPGVARSLKVHLTETMWEQIGAMETVARGIYADRQRMALARR